MKKFIRPLVLCIVFYGILLTGCKKDPEPPKVTTNSASEITLTSATIGGNVTNDGGAEISSKGMCWGTSSNPSTSDNYSIDGTGPGEFTSLISDLVEGTVYYVRAYATNKAGTGYGNEESFSTLQSTVPALTTRAITGISFTTASSGGDILNNGGAEITAKGICWNTSENPVIGNSHTTDGASNEGFTSNMTGLTEGTTYYVRAYATNSKGTAYGNQVTFATTAVGLPSVTTKPVTNATSATASSGGDISNDGGSAITARGVCWNTTENPVTTDSHTSEATGTTTFVSNLTGLTEATKYYVRAYAVNSKGISYGNQQTFTTLSTTIATLTTKGIADITLNSAKSGGDIQTNGGTPVTAKGVCWSISENPTTANNHTTDGVGSDGFVSNITGLNAGTKYYVRSYAVNSKGTAYGNQESFTTTAAVGALVLTAEIKGLTSTGAISGGYVSSDGGSPVTERGVCWSTSPNPTVLNTKTSNGTGTGTFVSNITGLSDGTVYYIRAYAANSAGVSYGAEFKILTMVNDIEGNVYKTVAIGNQVWMAENLRTTKYNNNTNIPIIISDATWMALDTLHTPGFCWYLNSVSYKSTYGALYNWFTLAQGNLCPQGWHVPTYSEYNVLERQLGVPADSVESWGWRGLGVATKMKTTTGWISGNGDNQSGLSILPAGYRSWVNGEFRGSGEITYFWTSTDDSMNHKNNTAWYRRLDASETRIYNATTDKGSGKSVRCMKNP